MLKCGKNGEHTGLATVFKMCDYDKGSPTSSSSYFQVIHKYLHFTNKTPITPI